MYKFSLILLVCVFLLSCGTVTNLQRPPISSLDAEMTYYGGVIIDSGKLEEGEESAALVILDFPFSFIFDTVTLPVVFLAKSYKTFEKYEEDGTEESTRDF